MYRLISADSHADAPEKVYFDNVPKQFHGSIPHVEKADNGKEYLILNGIRILTMNEGIATGRPATAWNTVREGAGDWEPEKRLRDGDRDNVVCQVVQGGASWTLFDPDADAQFAIAKVWNDWAMDTYKPYQSRIQPSAVLPIKDIARSVAEAKRIAAMGYSNVQMPIYPAEKPYRHRDYDPLWAVLQETGLTVNLHIKSGTVARRIPLSAGRVNTFVAECTDAIITAADLCSTGVLERFPGLKFVFLECGGGWVSWLMHTMDGIYAAHPDTCVALKKYPSEYFKQSLYCAIMMDSAAMRNIQHTGAGIFVFSNDYPHAEGTWPESQQRVAKQLEGMGLSQDEIELFTYKNAERIYKFPSQSPTTDKILADAAPKRAAG